MANRDSIDRTSITLRRGSLYLSAEIYLKYFAGLEAVVLLERDAHLYIMPVRNASGGGYLLKLKDSNGSRIINAMDFFRDRGKDSFDEIIVNVFWDQEMSALKSTCFFA